MNAIPSGIEAGMRIQRDRRSSEERRSRQSIGLLASAAIPTLVTGLARRRGRHKNELNQLGWAGLAIAMGVVLERRRQMYRDEITSSWIERTTPWIERELEASRIRVQTVEHPGHNFKKTLIVLGRLGSDLSWVRGQEQMLAQDTADVSATSGRFLGHVTTIDLQVSLADPRDGAIWLTNDQVDHLLAFIASVDEGLGAAEEEDELTVLSATGRSVDVEYRDQNASLRPVRPAASALVDPIGLSLLIGAAWKATTPITAGVFVPLAATAAAIDVLGYRRYARTPPRGEDRHEVIGASVLSTALLNLGIAAGFSKERGLSGEAAFAATSSTLGLLLTLGRYSPLMTDREKTASYGFAGALWSLAAARSARRDPLAAIAEVAFLVMIPWATAGLDARIEHEADLLEASLDEALGADLRRAGEQGADEELSRLWDYLRFAEDEIERLSAQHSDLDPIVMRDVRQDCANLRLWLETPGVREWLVG